MLAFYSVFDPYATAGSDPVVEQEEEMMPPASEAEDTTQEVVDKAGPTVPPPQQLPDAESSGGQKPSPADIIKASEDAPKQRRLPLFVQFDQAENILLALKEQKQRRPATHLTWERTLEAGGIHVERVLVTRLVRDTFYARIIVRPEEGKLVSIDAKPSDALALALRSQAPVYVSKTLFESMSEDVILPGDPAPIDSDMVEENSLMAALPPISVFA